jgi:hypothetical protein
MPQQLHFTKKSIKISQKVLRPTHPDLFGSYNCFRTMYEAVDDYAEGVPLFESAMNIGQHS